MREPLDHLNPEAQVISHTLAGFFKDVSGETSLAGLREPLFSERGYSNAGSVRTAGSI